MAWTEVGNLKGPQGDAGAGTAGIPIKSTQTGNYTFVLDDANACVIYSNDTTPGTFTLPSNTDVDYPLGTCLYVMQRLSSPVTINGAVGVFLESTDGYKNTAGNFTWLKLTKIYTNGWVLTPLFSRKLYPGAKVNGTTFTGIADVELRYAKVSDASFFVDASTIGTPLATVALTADVPAVEVIGIPSGYGATFAVRFKQDATGGWEVTWPASFKFVAGSDTQVQQAANAMTLLVATTFDQGTRWECVMKACG